MYNLGFYFLGRLAVVAQLGKLCVLVLLNGAPACFCLFLFCELYHVVYGDMTIERLADVDIVRVKIVIIISFDNHYYDEDDIEVGKAVSCQVAVNHVVELTEEEKAEARQEAIKQYQREELAKIQSRNTRVKKTENIATQVQPSLFDF